MLTLIFLHKTIKSKNYAEIIKKHKIDWGVKRLDIIM